MRVLFSCAYKSNVHSYLPQIIFCIASNMKRSKVTYCTIIIKHILLVKLWLSDCTCTYILLVRLLRGIDSQVTDCTCIASQLQLSDCICMHVCNIASQITDYARVLLNQVTYVHELLVKGFTSIKKSNGMVLYIYSL